MRTRDVLSDILNHTPVTCKWKRRLITALFTTLLALRGRATFVNLARFAPLHEQTFRRHFGAFFDWVAFNLATIALAQQGGSEDLQCFIGAIDCTFIPKAGTQTYGLDRFWSSTASASRCGLEVSVFALIEPASGRAFTLDATQTPPNLAQGGEGDIGGGGTGEPYSRIDFYMEQVSDCLGRARQRLAGLTYIVADGLYAKNKVLAAMEEAEAHLLTRLRSDANLRYLYDGPRKPGPGAPKRYDGKVDFQDLSRFEHLGNLPDKPRVQVYAQRLNSPHFKRDFQVVVLLNTRQGSYVVLASTDLSQSPWEVVRFYRSRFQIEFIFREAKQFTGLTHCQARSQAKLDFHFNMSLAALNVARLELALGEQEVSVRTYVRRAYNRLLVGRLLSKLGLRGLFGLNHPGVREVVRTGSVAY